VREIDGETLVYDRGHDVASCLSEFAARVWRRGIRRRERRRAGRDERVVWLALHQLPKRSC
jgi:hypothetical protein